MAPVIKRNSYEPTYPKRNVQNKRIVGADLGLKNLITLSNGEYYPNPFYILYENNNSRIKQWKKVKSKTKRKQRKNNYLGSESMQKMHNNMLTLLLENRALMYHDICQEITVKYNLIYLESTNLSFLNKGLGDVTNIPLFVDILKFRAELNNCAIITVSHIHSSNECAQCGRVRKKKMKKSRYHYCNECHYKTDRDINAAQVLRKRGDGYFDSSIEYKRCNNVSRFFGSSDKGYYKLKNRIEDYKMRRSTLLKEFLDE